MISDEELLQRMANAQEIKLQRLQERNKELQARVAELEEKLHQVAMIRCWTNEDGKRFLFAEDLAKVLRSKEGEGS